MFSSKTQAEPKGNNESKFISMTKERFDHVRTVAEDAETLAFVTREFKDLFACFDRNLSNAVKRDLSFVCPLVKPLDCTTPSEIKHKFINEVGNELKRAGWNSEKQNVRSYFDFGGQTKDKIFSYHCLKFDVDK